jgi:hypothetical protein
VASDTPKVAQLDPTESSLTAPDGQMSRTSKSPPPMAPKA